MRQTQCGPTCTWSATAVRFHAECVVVAWGADCGMNRRGPPAQPRLQVDTNHLSCSRNMNVEPTAT